MSDDYVRVVPDGMWTYGVIKAVCDDLLAARRRIAELEAENERLREMLVVIKEVTGMSMSPPKENP